jgi:hypothetical protein
LPPGHEISDSEDQAVKRSFIYCIHYRDSNIRKSHFCSVDQVLP